MSNWKGKPAKYYCTFSDGSTCVIEGHKLTIPFGQPLPVSVIVEDCDGRKYPMTKQGIWRARG